MGRVVALDLDVAVAEDCRAHLLPLKDISWEAMNSPAGLKLLEREPSSVEAVVVGRQVADPVQTAQRVFAIAPELPVLILAHPQRGEEIRRALQFAPLVGEQVRCVMMNASPSPAETLCQTIERARKRLEYSSAVSAINARLTAAPAQKPTPAAEILGRILERAPIGVVVVDRSGVITGLNPHGAKIFSISENKAVGRRLHELFGPAEGARWQAFFRRLDESSDNFVESITGPQGSHASQLEISGAPLTGRDGTPGYVVLFQDSTEQNRLIASERIARADAEAANRTKDEFLAMLGHELRNPLAPIVTALQLMEMSGGDSRFPREQKIIERQVQHLVHLVDDLLDISRITRGQVLLDKEPVEMATIVARAVEQVRPLIEQSAHDLQVTVPPHGLRVHGDPTRLAQVLTNLLTNAGKYTERRGVISVNVQRVGDEVELSVCDTGIGIRADMLPRIFDNFIQGERGIARSQGGLGLGLAIARNLVTLHGGSIRATSAGEGGGSEFIVRLPAMKEATKEKLAPTAAAHKAAARPRDNGRVLVVDDNADAADLLAMTLTSFGYEVSIAYDGTTALKLALEIEPRAVVCDIGLPDIDGYEVARRLRSRSAGADVHLIALTGYGQESDKAMSKKAGFDAHVVKPANLLQLRSLLEKATAPRLSSH